MYDKEPLASIVGEPQQAASCKYLARILYENIFYALKPHKSTHKGEIIYYHGPFVLKYILTYISYATNVSYGHLYTQKSGGYFVKYTPPPISKICMTAFINIGVKNRYITLLMSVK